MAFPNRRRWAAAGQVVVGTADSLNPRPNAAHVNIAEPGERVELGICCARAASQKCRIGKSERVGQSVGCGRGVGARIGPDGGG